MRLIHLIPLLLYFVTACATSPDFNTDGINNKLTPKNAVTDVEISIGQRVIWGGVILSSQNMQQSTQLEILSYPLDSNYLPQTGMNPQGRFIIKQPGFLETTLYTEGRMVSVMGSLLEHQPGKVGDADYLYPVVESSQLHLWAREAGRNKTSFHFGLGVQL